MLHISVSDTVISFKKYEKGIMIYLVRNKFVGQHSYYIDAEQILFADGNDKFYPLVKCKIPDIIERLLNAPIGNNKTRKNNCQVLQILFSTIIKDMLNDIPLTFLKSNQLFFLKRPPQLVQYDNNDHKIVLLLPKHQRKTFFKTWNLRKDFIQQYNNLVSTNTLHSSLPSSNSINKCLTN